MRIYKGLLDYYHPDNLSAQSSANIQLELESFGIPQDMQNIPIFDILNQTVAFPSGSFSYQRDLIKFSGQPNQIGQFMPLVDLLPHINNAAIVFTLVENMLRAYEEFRDLPSH